MRTRAENHIPEYAAVLSFTTMYECHHKQVSIRDGNIYCSLAHFNSVDRKFCILCAIQFKKVYGVRIVLYDETTICFRLRATRCIEALLKE